LVRRMSAKDARANFGELLGSVYYTKEPVVVEKKGKPYAVLISPEQYEILHREKERAWATVDRIRERNADKTEEEIAADVTAEVEAVRQELYEQGQR
jgi:prevent-host-death family protein